MENCEYLAKFEAHLVKAPYFNGKRPGFIDVHIFENLELPDKFKFPLTHNWYMICSIFHPTVRESWKVIKGKNAANFGIEHPEEEEKIHENLLQVPSEELKREAFNQIVEGIVKDYGY